jgi:uncharacterized membrane protein
MYFNQSLLKEKEAAKPLLTEEEIIERDRKSNKVANILKLTIAVGCCSYFIIGGLIEALQCSNSYKGWEAVGYFLFNWVCGMIPYAFLSPIVYPVIFFIIIPISCFIIDHIFQTDEDSRGFSLGLIIGGIAGHCASKKRK